jgi:hypothetical protein
MRARSEGAAALHSKVVLILWAGEELLNEAGSLPKLNETTAFGNCLCLSDRFVVIKAFNDLHAREMSVSVHRIINAIFGRLLAAPRFDGDAPCIFGPTWFASTGDFVDARR